MNTVTQSALAVDHRRFAPTADGWMAVGVLGFIWLLLLARLRVDWSVNPQYGYGWIVPVLALALTWRRWRLRPAPNAAPTCRLVAIAACGLLLLWLPLRMVEEANPEWRLVLWVHALVAVMFTLCVIFMAGGWEWVRHFVVPVAFLLLAVPWPMAIERAVIQNLMRLVAMVTVELLDAINIPAVQHGNIIEIAGGIVGVDEACSGVRSLQTTLLVCVFLGEFYRFTPLKRGLVLAAGIVLAVAANIGRTLFLVRTVSVHGFDVMHRWHDAAGIAVVVVILAGVWSLTLRLQARERRPSYQWSGSVPPIRRSVVAAALCWLVVAEVATECWCRF